MNATTLSLIWENDPRRVIPHGNAQLAGYKAITTLPGDVEGVVKETYACCPSNAGVIVMFPVAIVIVPKESTVDRASYAKLETTKVTATPPMLEPWVGFKLTKEGVEGTYS